MKSKLDKLKSIFIINKQITIFLLGLSIIAVIAGAFYITILNKADHTLIKTSVNDFFNSIQTTNLTTFQHLKMQYLQTSVLLF